MSSSDKGKKDYDIGYGKPPKHTQWKKDQSGNPSGKRKKAETVDMTLKKLALKEIVANENGKPVTMTQQEAMCATVFMKAMKGDIASAKFIAAYLASVEAGQASVMQYELKPADIEVLETHAQWVAVIEQARTELASQADNGAMDGTDEVDGEDA